MNSRKRKILIPAMPLDGGASGIAMYTINMVKYLSAQKDFEVIVVGLEGERALLEIGANGNWMAVSDEYSSNTKNIFWHAYHLPKLAKKLRVDLVWLPAGNRRMVMKSACETVVISTVHDLAHFRLPEKYDVFRNFYVRQVLPLAWKKADRLIAVSEQTKQDLSHFTHIPATQVDVVSNGFDSDVFYRRDAKQIEKELANYGGLPSKYILYVARLEHPGKGHSLLLRAFQQLLEKWPNLNHHLVFAGKDWNGAEEVHRLIELLGLGQRVHTTGFVAERMLPYLYCGADLVAFPSLWEGFGIPILEAMASGVPVISSNRGALPEVAKDAAIIFDPENNIDFVSALEAGIFDEECRQELVRLGQQRVRSFSWETCANTTAELFRRQLVQ